MISFDEQLFAEFEDLLDKHDDELLENINHDFDEEEAVVHKLNASALLLNDLLTEMENRGLQPRGFFEDDAKVLQAEFDKEHESYVQSKRREMVEAREIEAKQAIIQNRKMTMDTQMKEERQALQKDRRFQKELGLIANGKCKPHLRIEVNDITIRCIAKAVWQYNNIRSLDVSNMDLSDLSGSFICRSLRNNRSIEKLELGGNNFGKKTCFSLADSLTTNDVVKFISLECNPLTGNTNDVSGIETIAKMLKVNNTLTHMSIWQCNINNEGCQVIYDNFKFNESLICFDLFYNDWEQEQIQGIYRQLQKNRENRERRLQHAQEVEAERKEKENAERLVTQNKKESETKEKWIEDKKKQRSESRRVELDRIAQQKQEELKRLKEEEEAKLEAAKLAANSKKKKKPKKKK